MSMQSNGLYLDEVVHKAFVEISEEGTQAAAATGFSRVDKNLCFGVRDRTKHNSETLDKNEGKSYKSLPEFSVDRPFLFMILYKDQTLFMGKVTSL